MKTKVKRVLYLLLCGIMILSLASCGGEKIYLDGTFEGQSQLYEGEDDGSAAGYGVVSITIKDNVITECEYSTYEPDGTLKDSEYGKQNGEVANQDFYNKAQRAVQACTKYAEQLVEVGDAKKVDAISGATVSYNEFQEAVEDALNKAL